MAVTTADDERNLIIGIAAAELGVPTVHAHGSKASLCDLSWRHRAQDAPETEAHLNATPGTFTVFPDLAERSRGNSRVFGWPKPQPAATCSVASTTMKKLILLLGILSLCCLTGCETTGSGYQQSYANEPEGC